MEDLKVHRRHVTKKRVDDASMMEHVRNALSCFERCSTVKVTILD